MTNPFFNTSNNTMEQNLLNGIVVESIQIMGQDVYYLPRRTFNLDKLYTEDPSNYFDTAYPTTMYLKNVEGFQGMGNFLSKFSGGLEIRDQCTWTVANNQFQDDVGILENFTRPREGDLVFFVQNQKLYEIVFTEKFNMFYPLGGLYSYDMTCQLYEYSGQPFTTGIPGIDAIQARLSEDYFDYGWLNEDGSNLLQQSSDVVLLETYSDTTQDPLDETDEISKEASAFLDFTEKDPFSEGVFS